MCDTILAPPSSTAEGAMLFGKNSDRQRNEAQVVEFHPAASHATNAAVNCTYITVPQAPRTKAILICRPFWMWGAEMGANTSAVVIGNEAVHAQTGAQEEPALLGDDLVRLALERANSAAEAVDIIVRLLERYGQGGNNGHLTPSYFNNAFMIADPREAFVLETVGRDWLLERVDAPRSMSNRYSIDGPILRKSSGLDVKLAEYGWSDGEPESYADVLANPNREHLGHAGARRRSSTSLLRAGAGALDAAAMMAILRDHGYGDPAHPQWAPDACVRKAVCMHAGAPDSPGQSTGTLVSEIRERGSVHWVTATSAPCTSIFKPIFLDALPDLAELCPTDRFDLSQLWWRHELTHRAAISGDMAGFLADMQGERDALEATFQARVKAVLAADPAERQAVVRQCWADADAMEARWLMRVDRYAQPRDEAVAEGWARFNEIAGVPAEGFAAA